MKCNVRSGFNIGGELVVGGGGGLQLDVFRLVVCFVFLFFGSCCMHCGKGKSCKTHASSHRVQINSLWVANDAKCCFFSPVIVSSFPLITLISQPNWVIMPLTFSGGGGDGREFPIELAWFSCRRNRRNTSLGSRLQRE